MAIKNTKESGPDLQHFAGGLIQFPSNGVQLIEYSQNYRYIIIYKLQILPYPKMKRTYSQEMYQASMNTHDFSELNL